MTFLPRTGDEGDQADLTTPRRIVPATRLASGWTVATLCQVTGVFAIAIDRSDTTGQDQAHRADQRTVGPAR
ncbi:MAG: hypothetical protein EBT09_01710 [Actinobacteria bacterium]|nr:hypothetical protein [Actinomycetota bacterium]